VRIAAHGLDVDLPPGWDGRIYRRHEGHPILHAGSFPLPKDDGDFGVRAVAAMGPSDVFLALLEYEAELADAGLFASHGIPFPLRAADVDPRALQRLQTGRAGVQRFFSAGRRAFCLYVVVGTGRGAAGPVDMANEVLRTLAIQEREPA